MPLICRPIDKLYLYKTTLNIIFIKEKDYLSSFVRKKSQKDKKSPKKLPKQLGKIDNQKDMTRLKLKSSLSLSGLSGSISDVQK